MKVPYVDLASQWHSLEDEALTEIVKVLRGGKSIGDPVIEEFENRTSQYLGVKKCISLNSGTDALLFGLMALGIGRGDEVITVANSFIASTAAIAHVGAKPIFVDVGDDHLIDPYLIEAAITPRTKAIMPVHLEGKVCNMQMIAQLGKKYGLNIVEDAAQSIGSTFDGNSPGQNSDLACFSFHPLKNLNGIGDGGLIATNRVDIANRISTLRNHGLEDRETATEFGFVSRLDSIQAAILNLKLKYLGAVIEKRQKIAQIYNSAFNGTGIKIPVHSPESTHTYHLYVVELENRDLVQNELDKLGVQTKVHYPKLICDQPAYKAKFGELDFELPNTRNQSKRILSLPIHQNLDERQVEYVISNLINLVM